MIPQRWSEVSYSQAEKLFQSDGSKTEIIKILARVPAERLDLKIIDTLWAILNFVEEYPELVENKIDVPNVREWPFKVFEYARQAIQRHPDKMTMAFSRITYLLFAENKEVKHKDSYVEIGAKACDMMREYISYWTDRGFFDEVELEPEQESAGIERVQAFGVYSILETVAAKYGVLPKVIEDEPTHWVLLEWAYTQEKVRYLNEYQQLKMKK